MTLYEFDEQMLELIEMLEEDPDNEAIKQTIDMILLDGDDKAEDYVHVIRQLEADAEAAKAEKLRLARRQSAAENGAKRLRENLKYWMLLTGRQKIKRPTCSMSTSSRWSVVIDTDPENLPEEFQKVTVEAKKAEIEKWLKADQGRNAQECEWAHLEQVETLTIR